MGSIMNESLRIVLRNDYRSKESFRIAAMCEMGDKVQNLKNISVATRCEASSPKHSNFRYEIFDSNELLKVIRFETSEYHIALIESSY